MSGGVIALANLPVKTDSNGYLLVSTLGGTAQLADGSAAAPSLTFASDPITGFYNFGSSRIGVTGTGTLFGLLAPAGFYANSLILNIGSQDVQLRRSAAKTLTIDTDGAGGALTLVDVKGPLTASGNASATIGPSSPIGTTSTTLVMAGLGGSITTQTGKILLTMSGYLTDNTANDGTKCQLSYGTGTAPINGAALTGTQVGPIVQYNASTLAAGASAPYSASWIVTGLTKNTAYWFDTAFAAITGGTGSLVQASMTACDIP